MTINEVISWLREDADAMDHELGEGTEPAGVQREAADMLEGLGVLVRPQVLRPADAQRIREIA